MGDTGSLALGGAMATIAILTNHEITLIVVAGVFVLETLSAIVQVLSVRFRGKKVFLMTPLHHHYEKLGYAESDIVRTFYALGLILSMLAIGFGVWL
jgi:phospho-N-acetylmuramoyl-pentapeptide-transferase